MATPHAACQLSLKSHSLRHHEKTIDGKSARKSERSGNKTQQKTASNVKLLWDSPLPRWQAPV
jgi:hypothetical protein